MPEVAGLLSTQIHPVTPARWRDLEKLFGPRGAYFNCWCMFWRLRRRDFHALTPEKRKGALRTWVRSGAEPGLIAYRQGKAVAWCAIAPRSEYAALAASPTLKPVGDIAGVWSITCYFVAKEHRRTGPFLLGRSNVGSRFRNLWACADGFVSFAIQGGPIGRHTGRMLAEWMAERGTVPSVIAAIDWDRFDNTTLSQAEVDDLEAAIAPFLRSLTKAEFFDEVISRKMLGYPVSDASDSLADPQLRARDFWRRLSPAEGLPPLPIPGGFALFDGERPGMRRRAPRIGEHNAEIFGAAGVGPEELARLRAAGVV